MHTFMCAASETMPKVSVIMPNFNHAPYLKQRMDSILAQDYPDFEVILLDDASTDNSVELLKQYSNHPQVKALIVNETNSGNTFAQWHRGIQQTTGDYIWIAEADLDNYALPRLIEILIDSI